MKKDQKNWEGGIEVENKDPERLDSKVVTLAGEEEYVDGILWEISLQTERLAQNIYSVERHKEGGKERKG